ncbi:MAG TPA: hypothetical protein VJC16_06720 [Candidatus Nanoarchaeia archaeon]|nr:hypothetical protein [Candidatus Nanoarchaeia archaeon]
MHKVLIVEDDEEWQLLWEESLSDQDEIQIIHAFSIPEAEEQFEQNPGISAVVMDACVPGDEPNTVPLVQKMRKSFSGPMIAASSAKKCRDKLVAAGCSHQADKCDIPQKLLQVLGIS